MESIVKWGMVAFITLFIGAAIAVFTAFPTMLLWNALMPELFGLKTIDFFQALMLSLLCSLLFKSTNSSTKN